MSNATVIHGDCIDVMRTMDENSVDAIVTDPPYGLGFMGKKWDDLPPGKEWAEECLRVLKPGGHLLAFGGSRTWHRLAVAIEDAGFEMRDSIAWLYGSGFPKSMDVSKAIDKAAGVEREVVGTKLGMPGYSLTNGNGDHRTYGRGLGNTGSGDAECAVTAPATPAAQQWEGWGTALKPAFEPVVMARKPFPGTVAANVLEHGTGALNIDASRINPGTQVPGGGVLKSTSRHEGWVRPSHADGNAVEPHTSGRWPANVILDEGMAEVLDEQSGVLKSGARVHHPGETIKGNWRSNEGRTDPSVVAKHSSHEASEGGASRFFYVAKAPKRERPVVDGVAHPTVKPLALMRYLVKLVTPPNGTVLEPFAGSGATVEACMLEGFGCIAIERELEYIPLIEARIERTTAA